VKNKRAREKSYLAQENSDKDDEGDKHEHPSRSAGPDGSRIRRA
jgi:hypothetical protein